MSSILKVSEIQDPTNGNTALSIDSSGEVAFGQYYVPNDRWLAMAKDGHQSLTASTMTKVTFQSTTGSNGLSWDSTNHRVTFDADSAGTYHIIYQLSMFASSNNMGDIRGVCRKNGSNVFGGYIMIVSGSTSAGPFDLRHWTTPISGIVTVASGDYVDFHAYANGGGLSVFKGDSTAGERATNVFIRQIG